jgi:uncharacterized repeat protein (TIGR01451 family)
MNMLANFLVPIAAMAFALAPLQAQQAGDPVTLSGDVKAVKIVTEADGSERTELVEPGTIVPGDRLVFGTDYANNGSDAVTNFNVTNPLPSAVRLAPDADPALTVSVDGGKTWGLLSELEATNADGTRRAAIHADVTHVRWVLANIAPGEKGRLTYPAIIR